MHSLIDESGKRWRRWTAAVPSWLWLAICYVAFLTALDAPLWRPGDLIQGDANYNVAEARAWLDGRLDLGVAGPDGRRPWDTALFGGRFYNPFPPAFTLVCLGVLPFSPEGVPHWLSVAMLALPLPGLAFSLFTRRTGSHTWGCLLTLTYLLGTSLLPVAGRAVRYGSVYHVNHVLSQIGLMIFLLDFWGRRRVWPGGAGLLLAAWSRQLTVAFALPLIAAALAEDRKAGRGRNRTIVAVALVALVGVLPLVLNTLKFGHPLDSGYAHLYEGRSDKYAEAAEDGLFGLRFVPDNLYHMNLGFPRLIHAGGQWHVRPNMVATGIWWTTPLLLGWLVSLRRSWRDGQGRTLLIAIGLVWVGLLCYHATGAEQRGYNRFSLDYVVVMLAMVAPYCRGGWLRWFGPAALVWSVIYFGWLI
ncbi:MAG: hypothetical protein ACE5GE_05015 [Phycisphaerae bacterium]